MRYYVVSDIHGFCVELKQALRKAGYFVDSGPHKLVLLGDLLDRGEEALEMEEFILTLMKRDELILIRGDHEDLFEEFVTGHWQRDFLTFVASGTYDSTLQLTDYTNYRVLRDVKRFLRRPGRATFTGASFRPCGITTRPETMCLSTVRSPAGLWRTVEPTGGTPPKAPGQRPAEPTERIRHRRSAKGKPSSVTANAAQ